MVKLGGDGITMVDSGHGATKSNGAETETQESARNDKAFELKWSQFLMHACFGLYCFSIAGIACADLPTDTIISTGTRIDRCADNLQGPTLVLLKLAPTKLL